MKNFKDLNVWQQAIDLADTLYDVTESYPKSQMYSLVQQIQKCGVSVPSNIAEGSERGSTADFIRFLYIAKGSLAELETQLIISHRRKYITDLQMEKFSQEILHIDNMLYRLITTLKNKAHSTERITQ